MKKGNFTIGKQLRMNLAIRGIDANLGPRNADSFRSDLHPDLKADFILANPPFNMSDWSGKHLRQDVRWKFGIPPVNNANNREECRTLASLRVAVLPNLLSAELRVPANTQLVGAGT